MMPIRILVLDSEPMALTVIADILRSGGYAVDTACTVRAAIEIMNASPPNLLVTNVYLPGITGRDAIRLLKGLRPDLPFLMVSGLPDSELIDEWAGKIGFELFPKPFESHALLDKVRVMLGRNPDPSISRDLG